MTKFIADIRLKSYLERSGTCFYRLLLFFLFELVHFISSIMTENDNSDPTYLQQYLKSSDTCFHPILLFSLLALISLNSSNITEHHDSDRKYLQQDLRRYL